MAFKLHVSGSSVGTTCDTMKALVGAAATGHMDAVVVVPADTVRVPFGRPVALEIPGGRFVFAANEIARFFALKYNEAKGGDAFHAQPARTDEWLAWEDRVLQPLVPLLVNAAQQGALQTAADGSVTTSGVPALATSTAAAFAAAESALAYLNDAVTKSAFLSSETSAGVADWLVVVDLVELLPLLPTTSHKHLREYMSRVTSLSAFALASSHMHSVDAIIKPDNSGLDTSSSVQGELNKLIMAAVVAAYPRAKELGFTATLVTFCTKKVAHQYQCADAMSLCAKLKAGGIVQKPMEVAQSIVNNLPPSPLVSKVEASAPGFLNITLDPRYLAARINAIRKTGLQAPPLARPLKVLVDYSSPNIAKEMHVGHLRSTIIGDTIARILEFCGHDVERVNHVGDWGTQFGMLIAHLKDTHPDYATNMPPIADLSLLYKESKQRFDKEEGFKARAHSEVVKLQAGDVTNVAIWQRICDISAEMFGEVYGRLGIDKRLYLRGESFYNAMLPGVISELEAKGLLSDSEGASVLWTIPPEERKVGGKPPLMVRKRDGGVGYDSTDLAAVRYRLLEDKKDWLVYVVDSGQGLHFELVFEGAKLAGWTQPTHRVEHVGFGVVTGIDGKKFKTRDGSTVRLVDLLDEARDRMLNTLEERAKEGHCLLDQPDRAEAAAKLGYGGVKYFDLRQNRLSDYEFSYERMLSPDGDTAVYLEYAHARLCSILRKAESELGVNLEHIAASTDIDVQHPAEVALVSEIVRFQEVLEYFQEDLMPNRLTDYVYRVAVKFAEFFRDCRVIGSSEQSSRLLMCVATQTVIRVAFTLLGIEPVNRL